MERIALTTDNFTEGTPLFGIHRAKCALNDAEDELHQAVLEARAAGYSWGYVGAVLGTSRQAAEQRFNRPFKGWRED